MMMESLDGLDPDAEVPRDRTIEIQNRIAQIESETSQPQTRSIEPETTVDTFPVIIAARCGHSEALAALLEANANPHCKDGAGLSAYDWSVRHEFPDVLAVLHRFGITETRVSIDEKLLLAAEVGETDTVRDCLSQGANANVRDTRRQTRDKSPLMLAALSGHLAVVEALLAANADPNLTDRGDDVQPVCIDRGADVNAISKGHRTAVAIAAGASHNVRVDKNDRSSGSGIREYRDDGSCWEWQPLPEDQTIEVVQMLLQAGADLNIPNCETTPLIEAARNGRSRLLQILLDAGALLEVPSRDGDTAASMAKLYGRQEIRQFLQAHTGTDLSEFDRHEEEYDDNEEEDEDSELWGEDLPQPDFSVAAQNPDYQQAITDLSELCGGKAVSTDTAPGWFSIHVDSKRRKNIDTEAIQQQFLERGYFVYEPDSYYGDGPGKLCILPTSDKYDVIALHQTNGCNYGIGPGYVVEWLKELEAEQHFILTCIAHDTLAGRFLTPIEDPEGLAERMYNFCSDIVDQGCGEVEFLAAKLASNDGLYFWWD